MINQSFRLLCCVVLLVITGPLSAAPPSSAQINQLLEAGRTQQTMTYVTAYIVQTVMTELHSTLATQTSLSEEDKAIINVTVGSAIVKAGSWEQMRPHYQQLYARSLTANQAQVMLDFYRSPVGQTILMSLNEALQDSEVMEDPQMVGEIIEQAMANVEMKYLLEFQRLEQEHGVTQIYMQLFSDSVDLLGERVTPVVEEALTRELTQVLTK